MVEFKDVSFEYENGKPILSNINLKINEGESVGIIGANGAGKSTLMKALLGLIDCKGEIFVSGILVEKKSLPEVRRKLGYVLQESDNQMFMPTVYEDMMFAPLNYGHTREDADKRVDAVLAELNLSHLKGAYNHKISGGEKRMAAIATIICMKPKVIIMDEPSNALDPCNRRLVIDTINKLDNTKIIVSHDLDLIYDTCDRVILMDKGCIVADASRDDILKNKELLVEHRMELPLSFSR